MVVEDLREFFSKTDGPRQQPGDGLTSEEWGAKLGISQRSVHKLIKRAIGEGVLELRWRVVVRIDGRSCPIPVYQLVEPKKGKKQ